MRQIISQQENKLDSSLKFHIAIREHFDDSLATASKMLPVIARWKMSSRPEGGATRVDQMWPPAGT